MARLKGSYKGSRRVWAEDGRQQTHSAIKGPHKPPSLTHNHKGAAAAQKRALTSACHTVRGLDQDLLSGPPTQRRGNATAAPRNGGLKKLRATLEEEG